MTSSETKKAPPKIEVSEDDPEKIFKILTLVGKGSYGSVFKSVDDRDHRIVAVKQLPYDVSEQLAKEINILKKCKHEYVVSYRGTWKKNNDLWIVMEFCTASLNDVIEKCERLLHEEEIAAVMKMCIQGLQYLHENKIIHRDIKAGNILVTDSGECKLADFGVSTVLETTMKAATMIGTPYWMAPEVLVHDKYDAKADVWSLGITAIELATGMPPHMESLHPFKALVFIPKADPPTLPHPSDYSDNFNDFVRVCCQKDPSKRPTMKTLLSHPFILNAPKKQVIASLVAECSPVIDKKREEKAKEEAERTERNKKRAEEQAKLDAQEASNPKEDNKSSTMQQAQSEESGTMVVKSTGVDENDRKVMASVSTSTTGTLKSDSTLVIKSSMTQVSKESTGTMVFKTSSS
eukprot:TRINITY_DN7482_c0_g1_i1.p1 TRINITY_DN7482_c0_g1~~TRINITY_DN7482_c0_g1_i1.p1  ORF type:complete len:406 (-),score=96.31 TRINITY_DN7482_c0_g1_i1:120-1337(-)